MKGVMALISRPVFQRLLRYAVAAVAAMAAFNGAYAELSPFTLAPGVLGLAGLAFTGDNFLARD